MHSEQFSWNKHHGWQPNLPQTVGAKAQLVLVFGSCCQLTAPGSLAALREAYPQARLFGCSTADGIQGERVMSNSLTATAITFDHTQVQLAQVEINTSSESFQAGAQLGQQLNHPDLTHVFVLSDGLMINGSALIQGLASHLPAHVPVTGGLAGDGERFQSTLVLAGNTLKPGLVAAVGFYGQRLKVGYGSLGGWKPFGPERLITRSKGNVLYELDGKSALALYKHYLGEHARGLPATALLFPLSLRTSPDETGVVRTILLIDEATQSLTFAGDMPEGTYARLMMSNCDRLIDGAIGAAKTSYFALGNTPPELAILISCFGRKLVLKQRVEEEIESVYEIFGQRTVLTGFYSYGEISPFSQHTSCELHNQTMTITTFTEV